MAIFVKHDVHNMLLWCMYMCAQDLLQPIFVSPEDYGDLYLDIADAYMENSEFLSLS